MRYVMQFTRRWIQLAMLVVMAGCGSALTPPMAKRAPTKVNLGGVSVTDDYWWLRNKEDPHVIDYLKSENAYTDAILKPIEPLQDTLYHEMLGRIPETDETVPYRIGDWWYSSRTESKKPYPIYLRRKGSPTSQPIAIADVNAMAAGHEYFDYSGGEVSPDGNLLAFSTDITGNRQYIVQVKDLRNHKVLPDQLPLVDSYTWMQDNRTLYYVKEYDSKRGNRLYRHTLGTAVQKDDLVYEEKDDLFSIDVSHTRDRKWIICQSTSKTQSEIRVLPADRPAEPQLIEPRKANFEYYVDHRDGRFYIRANDTSRNFRIVTVPDEAPAKSNWTELVAADPAIIISDLDCFGHDLVLSERHDGLPQLASAHLPDGDADPASAGELKPRDIPFTEPDFSVSLSQNPEFDPPAIRFDYTSLTTPASVFDLNLSDGRQTLLKQQFAGTDFDRNNYVEQRLFATADDGTKIPISLVYRKQDGPRVPGPLLLEGYGSYGDPNDVYFSSSRLSLLNRGVTCATVHVRGGGEYGRAWYDAGRMKNKTNTFNDFIAAAKYLQANGWTTPKLTAIEGASAGGLLIGAVINRAPGLFHAAVADVPWVDVLADMSDPSIPLTTLEYIEWGNPNVPDERACIAAYDPYSNVRPQAYPDLLVLESLNDSQVQYWDAARWVATLRAAKQQAGPAGQSQLLLKMDMDAGHDGPSGLYSELHESALIDSWLLWRLSVKSE
jgi:oligopeptidase B